MNRDQPALHGGALALLAAALFGVGTPLVQAAGRGLGPFATAALLYAGAALAGALSIRPATREAALRRGDFGRLVAMAVFGAALGPAALAWGLQRTSAASASLMLTLEAVFTAGLAYLAYRETLDRRVAAALLALTAGGAILVVDRGMQGPAQAVGLAAVIVATLAWGVDNVLSRVLAERDPGQVVLGKCLLGAACTTLLAAATGEALPSGGQALGLLAIGAASYGASLRLYLLAQRSFGAGRTASVFTFAPFIGALVALILDRHAPGVGLLAGGGLMLAGVLLHLAETHEHVHDHAALEHEHAHRHDDGHHDHVHHPMPEGPHSHPHRHRPLQHAHAHVPDAHHAHGHGASELLTHEGKAPP